MSGRTSRNRTDHELTVTPAQDLLRQIQLELAPLQMKLGESDGRAYYYTKAGNIVADVDLSVEFIVAEPEKAFELVVEGIRNVLDHEFDLPL